MALLRQSVVRETLGDKHADRCLPRMPQKVPEERKTARILLTEPSLVSDAGTPATRRGRWDAIKTGVSALEPSERKFYVLLQAV